MVNTKTKTSVHACLFFSGPFQSERSHCCGWSRRGYRLRQINCPTGTLIVYVLYIYPYFYIATAKADISTLKDLL